jgi:outer membrane protein OmpA-like peptidoglycan-associated protein
MTVRKEGYAYNSEYFSQEDTTLEGVVTSEMEFKEMEVGGTYKLNDILFETNSAALTKESKVVIADFAGFLKENPKVAVAIHGHTDNIGDATSNRSLSYNRAKAVFDHLVSLGIQASRLSYNGYGQEKPVASNETPEGRAKNRRTEFVIVSK